MTTLKFADTHNMVAFLSKPTKSKGFEQIVDILNAHTIRYALTVNPTIYISCIEQFWSTAKAKTINQEAQIHAKVDGKKIIVTESSQGTDSDGGPKCQEAIRDSIAQTRLKFNELMALCTNLHTRVLDLEGQQTKIGSLKRRVKKLENKRRSRTHKLKRLYKVGLTARVESSDDEASLDEDAYKQGRRIDDIEANKDITLQDEHVVEEVVDASQVSTATTTVLISTEELTLDQALEALKTSKLKDNGKGIMVEELVKPKKQDQIKLDEEAALREKKKAFCSKKEEVIYVTLREKKKAFCRKKIRREKEQTTNTSLTEKDHVYLPQEHGRIHTQRIEII
nr:hypothetical protein [Tanacetum cinerariifolium]